MASLGSTVKDIFGWYPSLDEVSAFHVEMAAIKKMMAAVKKLTEQTQLVCPPVVSITATMASSVSKLGTKEDKGNPPVALLDVKEILST